MHIHIYKYTLHAEIEQGVRLIGHRIEIDSYVEDYEDLSRINRSVNDLEPDSLAAGKILIPASRSRSQLED